MSDFVIEDGVLVKYNGNDERAVIPEGVTIIGTRAFDGCECLTEGSIPEGVTEIGDFAFCGCESLESVVIPESVQTIGRRAFAWCKSLSITKVAIPKHLVLSICSRFLFSSDE